MTDKPLDCVGTAGPVGKHDYQPIPAEAAARSTSDALDLVNQLEAVNYEIGFSDGRLKPSPRKLVERRDALQEQLRMLMLPAEQVAAMSDRILVLEKALKRIDKRATKAMQAYAPYNPAYHLARDIQIAVRTAMRPNWQRGSMSGEQAGPCACRKCLEGKRDLASGFPITLTRMVLCARCGNKRCPHATDHDLPCTQSNEPGQAGSAYA